MSLLSLMILPMMVSLSRMDNPDIEFSAKTYPDEVSIGDSLFVVLQAKNIGNAPLEALPQEFNELPRLDVKIAFRCDDEHYEYLDEAPFRCEPVFLGLPSRLAPGEKKIVYVASLQMPPLDDLCHPFWQKIVKSLKKQDSCKVNADITYCFRDYGLGKKNNDHKENRQLTLTNDILVKLRKPHEMQQLLQWYESVPADTFPKRKEEMQHVVEYKLAGNKSTDNTVGGITIDGNLVNPWNLIPRGYRYPAGPKTPSTWQGWKELEESLTPSTMRDEIRLTRICIQYCDTKDDAVLKELKTWFDTMNEVQRTVMTVSLRKRIVSLESDDASLKSIGDVYRAISKYDNPTISARDQAVLKPLGLIDK